MSRRNSADVKWRRSVARDRRKATARRTNVGYRLMLWFTNDAVRASPAGTQPCATSPPERPRPQLHEGVLVIWVGADEKGAWVDPTRIDALCITEWNGTCGLLAIINGGEWLILRSGTRAECAADIERIRNAR